MGSNDDLTRSVRYDHLLLDDGLTKLTESVSISSIIRGGAIRPVPPSWLFVNEFKLSYGLCVDVYLENAWWEGVILDYEDGCEQRLVFFPELVEERKISAEQLRITHNWNEASGCWALRGNWLFLELVEEKKKELLVDLSEKEIWISVKGKEDYDKMIGDWTCRTRALWEVLVLEVVREIYPTLENDHNVTESQDGVHLPERPDEGTDQVGRIQPIFDLAEFDEDVDLNSVAHLIDSPVKRSKSSDSEEIVLGEQVENTLSGLRMDSNSSDNVSIEDAQGLDDILTQGKECWANIVSSQGSNSEAIEDGWAYIMSSQESNLLDIANFSCKRVDGGLDTDDYQYKDDQTYTEPHGKHMTPGTDITWLPALGTDVLPGAEYCPDALQIYLQTSCGGRESKNDNDNDNDNDTLRKVRKHLSCMGWKIEFKQDEVATKSMATFRYIAPDGETMYSLLEACRHSFEVIRKVMSQMSRPRPQSLVNVSDKLLDCNNLQDSSLGNRRKEVHVSDKLLDCNNLQDSSLGSRKKEVHVSDKLLDCNNLQHSSLGIHKKEVPKDDIYNPCCTPLISDISKSQVRPVGDNSSLRAQTTNLDLPEGESPPVNHVSDAEGIEAEYCPQAVIDWNEIGSDKGKVKVANQNESTRSLTLRAKKHLVAVGWRLWYITKMKTRRELRYTSPKGKIYISLVTACKACIEQGMLYGKTKRMRSAVARKKIKDQISGEFSSDIVCAEAEKNLFHINGQSKGSDTKSSASSQSEEQFHFGDVEVKEVGRCQEMQNINPYPQNQGDGLDDRCQTLVPRSHKRARQTLEPSPVHYTPQTVLSCLIDNNIILSGAKVYYTGRSGPRRIVEGQICREGIGCKCCNEVFSLTKFEAHSGSASHQPASHIFLEDGRSLLMCQKQILQDFKLKCLPAKSRERMKRNRSCEKHDNICSVCHCGGQLVLCDHCPSAFHFSCLGLNDSPEGRWFCPSCRCGICNQSEFHGDIEQLTENTILYCDQCEREYHVGCMRQKRLVKLESFPKGNWFCSEKCEQIFVDLHKLLGEQITVGDENLTWTILKSSKDEYLDASDSETTIEHQCKLNVALGVMHECFEPINESYTNKDLIEDVLFNKWSEMKQLNFWGFYTVLLERDDELISVATVRIYGDKLAEIPLVGTCFQYRHRGMCRILMDMLEKKLTELGVERLVVPAAPQSLHALTTTFGFSEMTSEERLKFLEYTFLDFQDSRMCQKILMKAPKSFESTDLNQLGDETKVNEC